MSDRPEPVPAELVPTAAISSGLAPSSNPTTVVVHSPSGGLGWRILAFLGWAGFCIVAVVAMGQFIAFRDYFDTSQGITEKFHSGKMFGGQKVAIISIEGLIADGDGFAKAQIDQIRDDENVKAVVVRVDSPGGTVTASDYILHHLKKLRAKRKFPLVVSMGGLAASGGYYVAMAVGDQEKSIFAEPTTTTGSIGVMLPHYDISGLLARLDVKDDTLVTHDRKEMGSITKPMSEEHRQLLQNYINESFERFKSIVKEGRPKFRQDSAALDELATGEIFSANRALKLGLVDEIGFVEDAIDRAIALAGLSEDDVRVIEFERPTSLLELTGMAESPLGNPANNWSSALNFATPRAYYLATTWPALMSTYSQLLGR
jgi:protease-4